MSEKIRLQKFIASLGVCSRRKAEELISSELVLVNGKTAKIGESVDPENDVVEIKGQKTLAKQENNKIYIALNKPVGYISSSSSEQGPSILELLTIKNCIDKQPKKITDRVFSVGRLDKDSEGLIILTNDGELTNLLTHPSFQHEKEYEVITAEIITNTDKEALEKPMNIDGQMYGGLKILKRKKVGKFCLTKVILKEGKNRHIRKMFGRLNCHILNLTRCRVGKYQLNDLPTGKWRTIKKNEII